MEEGRKSTSNRVIGAIRDMKVYLGVDEYIYLTGAKKPEMVHYSQITESPLKLRYFPDSPGTI